MSEVKAKPVFLRGTVIGKARTFTEVAAAAALRGIKVDPVHPAAQLYGILETRERFVLCRNSGVEP